MYGNLQIDFFPCLRNMESFYRDEAAQRRHWRKAV
jgi:hypothetical protein